MDLAFSGSHNNCPMNEKDRRRVKGGGETYGEILKKLYILL